MSYDVAQLVIEGKIKSNWKEADIESLSKNLGPYGGHTIEQMVQDIHNMQSIAVHLRKKRFDVFLIFDLSKIEREELLL